MPLALLLSPDDQAVSAITTVLEEMSVTCERPLDGASAAQKLNSNRFDLVLVDCENLPAAKLIFDVCRNRKGGGRPVPVAVVDGRAGLPTAFRLGAELILTKPVAKDQARITIRTALSRVKREDSLQTEGASPIHDNTMPAATTQESAVATSHESSLDATDHSAPQTQALAAAAGSNSFTSFSDPVPAFSETVEAMEMSAAVAEPETAPKAGSALATGTASKLDSSHSSSLRRFSGDPLSARRDESKVNTTADAVATVAAPAPVDTEAAGMKATAAAKAADDAKMTITAKPATATASIDPEASSDQVETIASQPEPRSEKKQVQRKQKKTGHLVTLFVLLVVCGGFYGAWTYEPGFQALAKSQINHLLVVLGIAQQPQPSAPAPARPASQMAKPNPGVPLQATAPAAVPASQPTATDPNAVPGPTSSPASTTPATLPASSSTGATTTPASTVGTQPASSGATQPNSTAAGQTATTTPAKPATAQSKSGVTRIQLPLDAVEHPVSPSASKSLPQH